MRFTKWLTAASMSRIWQACYLVGAAAATGTIMYLSTGCNSNSGPLALPSGGATEAKYTILLAEYRQADRFVLAQALQARAKQVLGSQDVWLEKTEEGVLVNYGHFVSQAPGSKAKRELGRVRGLKGQLQSGPLQFSYVRELPYAGPPTPAEYEIAKSGCAYTLLLAVYRNVPKEGFENRQGAAVQAVEALRSQGEQAYLFHGPFESAVYIGCFPESAVRQESGPHGTRVFLSLAVKAMQDKHQFHENGQRVYDIRRDAKGKALRLPRRPPLIRVADIVH